eukprot:TRINITY_DN8236_c0_g1_i2.p1 TRINITY_DN8236_c0_g1~~TRINITY_DN8236_c0_g1_i2.p1  ORF type:complete len:194 (-),score=50.91 TRINITY_DN8236_c0_g1_i2:304-885(-)
MLLAYVSAVFIVLLAAIYASFTLLASRKTSLFKKSRVLLVTAHPDDECMFFTPTLASLQPENTHILCLSTGNFDGLGAIRVNELVASAAVFGVPMTNVQCIDDPQLQDGMKNEWPADVIAQRVLSYVQQYGINVVITFDSYGISGHPNHIATYMGVKSIVGKASVEVYSLSSLSVFRKYLSVYVVFISDIMAW